MSNPYDADILDGAGNVRISGAVDFTDPDNQPGGAPTTREEWSGNGVAIAPNTFEWLTWNSTGGPDTLLDVTDPAHPTIITAGVYAVSPVVRCSGDGSSYFDATLWLDRLGFNASQNVRTYAATVEDVANDATPGFAWYVPAGGRVEVGVEYFATGVVGASCSILTAHIQRLA